MAVTVLEVGAPLDEARRGGAGAAGTDFREVEKRVQTSAMMTRRGWSKNVAVRTKTKKELLIGLNRSPLM
jgi:hypothetical protein